ncbi:F-box C protein [Caenorhabditis elegans]|uniref:F-box C protein n=1 Tax=Caenorhabditis elegans TaxID=6239 RepID=A3KFE0_CAEEL|nr:F-box C protein [Caenorhabditis elegans]CCD66387.1 F-box C protein [Caenorhabditis elegans]|eukprot:NP_001122628.1 F-box C protein [Caenorhabditis elegans]
MSTANPLSYSSLKCVIGWLEFNLRIQLSLRCPDLRCAEKSANLHLKNLELSQNSVIVNGTIYRFFVINSTCKDKLPYDLDEFGAMDFGAIANDSSEVLFDSREEHTERSRVASKLYSLKREPERIAQIEDEEVRAAEQEKFNEKVLAHQANALRSIARLSKSQVPLEIQEAEPLTQYLKLESGVLHPRQLWFSAPPILGEKRVEVLKYSRRLHSAVKYLVENLIGGRAQVNIQKLSIKPQGVLRLPKTLKFKISELDIGCWETEKLLNTIKPLLTFSSFPLKSLSIYGDSHFADPIIQISRQLCISTQVAIARLANLRYGHRNVFVKKMSKYMINDFLKLTKSFVENGRDLGSDARDFAESSGKLRRSEPSLIVVRMKNTAELLITLQAEENQENHWIVKLEVQEISGGNNKNPLE